MTGEFFSFLKKHDPDVRDKEINGNPSVDGQEYASSRSPIIIRQLTDFLGRLQFWVHILHTLVRQLTDQRTIVFPFCLFY